MRVVQKVNIQMFTDTGQLSSYLNLSDDAATQVVDNMQAGKWDAFNIAASATYTIPFADNQPTSVRSLWIRAQGDFDITLNGSATPIQVRRPNTLAGTFANFYFDGVVTSVVITNQTTAAVLSGLWAMTGDPA